MEAPYPGEGYLISFSTLLSNLRNRNTEMCLFSISRWLEVQSATQVLKLASIQPTNKWKLWDGISIRLSTICMNLVTWITLEVWYDRFMSGRQKDIWPNTYRECKDECQAEHLDTTQWRKPWRLPGKNMTSRSKKNSRVIMMVTWLNKNTKIHRYGESNPALRREKPTG